MYLYIYIYMDLLDGNLARLLEAAGDAQRVDAWEGIRPDSRSNNLTEDPSDIYIYIYIYIHMYYI